MTGTFGVINCFSFYANKIITTGEGGMCLTDDDTIAARLRMLKDIGFDPENPTKKKYVFDVRGMNYRMTNVQAAIGAAQLKKIEHIIARKRWVAAMYNKHLETDGIVTHPQMSWAKNVYWYYSILVDRKKRDDVIDGLEKQGVETRPFFHPINMLKIYKTDYKLPVAEDLAARGINLPSSPMMTEEQIINVSDMIKKIIKK
jgi:perosamine synthetase